MIEGPRPSPQKTKLKQPQQCKVVMLGDQSVGKSSIINRYIKNEFDSVHNPTIGIDFLSRSITVGGTTIRLQLWDTAGQQRFRSLIPGYLKNAMAALIVFDLTNLNSFEQVGVWIDMVRQVRGNQAKLYLIANKSDKTDSRVVQTEQLAEYASRQNLKYYQVSAKQGKGIQQMFLDVCADLASMQAVQRKLSHVLKPTLDQDLQDREGCC